MRLVLIQLLRNVHRHSRADPPLIPTLCDDDVYQIVEHRPPCIVRELPRQELPRGHNCNPATTRLRPPPWADSDRRASKDAPAHPTQRSLDARHVLANQPGLLDEVNRERLRVLNLCGHRLPRRPDINIGAIESNPLSFLHQSSSSWCWLSPAGRSQVDVPRLVLGKSRVVAESISPTGSGGHNRRRSPCHSGCRTRGRPASAPSCCTTSCGQRGDVASSSRCLELASLCHRHRSLSRKGKDWTCVWTPGNVRSGPCRCQHRTRPCAVLELLICADALWYLSLAASARNFGDEAQGGITSTLGYLQHLPR